MFQKAKKSAMAHPFFYPFLIILAGIIAYSNSFHVPFIFDDEYSIRDNRVVHDIGNFLFSSIGYKYNPRRFIGFLTFALNYRLGGLNVTGYHVVSLAIHIVCALLVYGLVAFTFRTPAMKDSSLAPQSRLIAFFSAALFVVHPIQTEAVTYIVQRLTSLAALFYVASLYCYVRFRLSQVSADGIHWQGYVQYGLAVASAVLAMKTKEISFTLPFIVVVYELVFFGSGNVIKRTLWALPLLATVVIIPLDMLNLGQPLGKVLSDVSQVTAAGTSMTRSQYLITEFTVIVTYIRLLFFPVGQNLDYDYPIYRSFFNPQVMLSFLFLVVLFGLGVYLVFANQIKAKVKTVSEFSLGVLSQPQPKPEPAFKLMGFGILWFFITLSVESSIIPITDVIYEHRVYLPSIGMIISIVTGIFLLREKVRSPRAGRAIIVMLSLAIGVLTVTTYMRNEVWGDSIRMWKDITAKSPAKERPHYNLAHLYQLQSRFDDAIEQYQLAIKLKPDADAYNNLGVIYRERNMPDKAIEQYMLAIKLNPDMPEAYFNLGNIDRDRNMPEKAMEYYQTAIELRPDYMEAHLNLGGVIYQAGKMPDKAIKEYLTAIKLKPDCAEAYNNLGAIYESLKMPDKAIKNYLIAVKLNPDYIEALNNLGDIYYKTGQAENARREFMAVLKIKPDNSKARQALNKISHGKSQ